jgi:hypothetical protein
MARTLEDLATYLEEKPNPADVPSDIGLFTEAIGDLRDRLRNLEYWHVQHAHRLLTLEQTQVDTTNKVAMLEGDQKTYRAKVDALEKAPAANDTKVEDLEKRVRAVEGAVGSTGYKKAVEAPKPAELPKPAEPAGA